MTVVHIQSSSQWETLLKTHNVVIADFYADWCGPCKIIAPKFESLSTQHSRPGKISFAKINVDTQQSISSSLGVRAMPTFKIFHCGRVIDTVQGANPSALAAAILSAVKLADKGTPGEVFVSTKGQRLGGKGVEGGEVNDWGFSLGGVWGNLVVFVGLYFVSLLSLDPYQSARTSSFNKVSPPPTIEVKTQAADGSTTVNKVVRPAFKTLADL